MYKMHTADIYAPDSIFISEDNDDNPHKVIAENENIAITMRAFLRKEYSVPVVWKQKDKFEITGESIIHIKYDFMDSGLFNEITVIPVTNVTVIYHHSYDPNLKQKYIFTVKIK